MTKIHLSKGRISQKKRQPIEIASTHRRLPFEGKIKEFGIISGVQPGRLCLAGENALCGNALYGFKIFIQVELGRHCL